MSGYGDFPPFFRFGCVGEMLGTDFLTFVGVKRVLRVQLLDLILFLLDVSYKHRGSCTRAIYVRLGIY